MNPIRPWSVWLELAAFSGLLLSYIWLWQGAFPGHSVVIVLAYFGLGVAMHLRRRETARDLGFRLDNLRPALRSAFLWVGPILAGVLLIGAIAGSWHFEPWIRWIPALAWNVVWGTAQQYGLLCVFYRRFREVLPGEALPIVGCALVFSLFHLPNPFLAPVTFAAGALSCFLYRKVPNVPALGIAHALLSFFLYYALPISTTHLLHVGPRMLER